MLVKLEIMNGLRHVFNIFEYLEFNVKISLKNFEVDFENGNEFTSVVLSNQRMAQNFNYGFEEFFISEFQ